jgi:tripartite-type tricarboxylate transporter receptor subunit TctC
MLFIANMHGHQLHSRCAMTIIRRITTLKRKRLAMHPPLTRRAFSRLALLLPTAAALPAVSQAGPGRLMVGYPAGGTLDATARRVADAWRKQGRNFLVDNRAGAAGRIANSQLKRERADGTSLLCTHTSALTIYPHVYTKLMYDAAADFVPVSPIVAATCAFAVSTAVPASVRTLQEYVSWVKQHSAHASYASPAAGSMAHFLGYRFSELAGLKLQHVAYRGSAPAMQDLMGGQIPAYFGFVADFLPYIQQGKVRILGVTGDQRSRFMQASPTFEEQGYAGVKGTETYGIFAPPGTPEAVVKSIYDAVAAAARDNALLAGFEQAGLETYTLTPQEYTRLIQRERDAWAPIVRASGFRSED